MMLSIEDLNVYYGESHILQGVNLNVDEGEIVCVIGRNGMGKTTLMRGIMQLTPPRSGRIDLHGKDLMHLQPYEVALSGIAYVPQGRQIFPDLTVAENLKVGALVTGAKTETPQMIFDIFPVLKERLKQKGGTLSGGEQQMLAVARALVANPKLVLLDEPSEGLQPSLMKALVKIVRDVNKQLGVSFLVVEQRLDIAFGMASRGYVMEKGQMVQSGAAAELSDESIIKKYLAV
jgi:urea transport system ATP-binding protein